MFFIIKFVFLLLFVVAVFFVPLGPRPLSGHLRAIWATPESQELKKEFLNNVLMLDTWMKTHQALSGESAKAGTADPGHPGAEPVIREADTPTPPRVTPAPVNQDPPATPKRRTRKQGSGRPRGETP